MESLYLLIPISLVLLATAVAIFFWAVNSGQYDDIDREGERILFDEDIVETSKEQHDSTLNAEEKEND